jgi:arylsulfatase A-like enzyme
VLSACHKLPAALLVVCTLACAASETPPSDGQRPDILLITVDTLRADHLGSYGYARKTTPFLDQLARSGTRFELAHSTASWTVPAVVSLLSSWYPARHGVVTGVVQNGSVYNQPRIPDDAPWLPELLRQAGYRTLAVVANGHLVEELGFARGFDRFECVGFRHLRAVRPAVDTLADELSGEGPTFFWLHLFEPHVPYVPREPWMSNFWPEGRPRFPELENRLFAERYRALGVTGGEELEYLRALYDSEIREADRYIEELLSSLPEDRERIVVVTSDHGEEFLEHGKFGHGTNLHEPSLRVPLIVHRSGQTPARSVVEQNVSLMDLPQTILDLAGIEAPESLSGRSLLPLIEGVRTRPRPTFAEVSRRDRYRAVMLAPWKLTREASDDGTDELYDLRQDPAEQKNRIGEEPELAERLVTMLEDNNDRAKLLGSEVETLPVSDQDVERLRALGYVD